MPILPPTDRLPKNVEVAFVVVAVMKLTVGEDVAPTLEAPVQ